MHLETFEPRCLMTNTGLDGTFGAAGAVTLDRGLRAKNVLATGGAVYVDAYRKADNTRYLLKYDNLGRLDRTWGQAGRVALNVFDAPRRNESSLAYEDRTGSVYVASVGLYEGARELDIERITAKGVFDTTFSTARVNLSGGSMTSGSIVTMLPLVHNKLIIAANVKELFSNDDGSITNGTDFVRLIRLNTGGTLDRTFNAKGWTTVFSGLTRSDAAGDSFDMPTLADVGNSNAGFYVVGLRHTTQYTDAPRGQTADVWSADLASVTTDGALVPEDAHSYVLNRARSADFASGAFRAYRPLSAQLNGEGVDVIGGRVANGGALPSPTLLRVGEERTLEQLKVPLGDPTSLVTTYGRRGQTHFVRTGNTVSKLRPTFSPDRSWGKSGRITVDYGIALIGIDDDFNLMAKSDDGTTLYRFDGTL